MKYYKQKSAIINGDLIQIDEKGYKIRLTYRDSDAVPFGFFYLSGNGSNNVEPMTEENIFQKIRKKIDNNKSIKAMSGNEKKKINVDGWIIPQLKNRRIYKGYNFFIGYNRNSTKPITHGDVMLALYNNGYNYKSDVNFRGRLWLNRKCFSFWNYSPSQSEIEKLSKYIENAFSAYGVNINFNDFTLFAYDREGTPFSCKVSEYVGNNNIRVKDNFVGDYSDGYTDPREDKWYRLVMLNCQKNGKKYQVKTVKITNSMLNELVMKCVTAILSEEYRNNTRKKHSLQ